MTSLFSEYRLWIFDADDTLRRTTVPGQPCPRAEDQWVLLAGVRERLRAVRWNTPGAPKLGVASNQDQVGAGIISAQTARSLLHAMVYAAAGIRLPEPAVQFCPHALDVRCACRKPGPAMLERIMSHYDIGPSATVLVGDQASDRAAARAARTAYLDAAEVFGWAQSA